MILSVNLLILALLASAGCITFEVVFKKHEKICFSEFITQSSPYHFRMEGDPESTLVLLFKDGTELVKNVRKDALKKIDSYAASSSEHQFCVTNLGKESKYRLSFYQGLQLSDLSALPKQEESKLINEMVDNINGVYQSVKEQENYSRTVNQYNMELQKLVSFKGVGFGFLSITVVLIVSFLHYLEIKRVLKNRKII